MRLRHDGVSWQEIDGELVILDLERSVYLTTNETGAFLAKQLLEEQTLESLVETMRVRYDLSTDRATGDVTNFLASLKEKQLLDD